jgi:hypothetical protein
MTARSESPIRHQLGDPARTPTRVTAAPEPSPQTRLWMRPFDDPPLERLADRFMTAMALRAVAERIEERCLSMALPPLLRRAAAQLDAVEGVAE